MTTELSISDARDALRDVVTHAEAGGTTYITRQGRRVAAVVPVPAEAPADRAVRLDGVITRILAEDAGLLKRLADC
jgi:prevent-host-death family protein